MSEPQPVPDSLLKMIGTILAIFNVLLAVFYLVGGTLSYFLFEGEVLSSGVMWVVFGVLVGFLNYLLAGQAYPTEEAPDERGDAAMDRATGRLVMLVTFAEVLLICGVLYQIWWRHIFVEGTGFEDLVPMVAYFGAIVVATFLARSIAYS